MIPERHRIQQAQLTDVQTESCTRRAFLERAVAFGFAEMFASALLAGCNASSVAGSRAQYSSDQGATLTWCSENDEFGIDNKLAEHFSAINDQGITVEHQSNQQLSDLLAGMKSGRYTPDIVSLDIIWIDEFVSSGLIMPLTELWNRDIHDNALLLPITMQSARDSKGQIWTAPFHTDMGLLYYRTDIISTPPRTWDELVMMAIKARSDYSLPYGYLWQGKGEGLVCNFVEVLSSYGGTIVDKHNPELVVIGRNDAALRALNEMLGWIDISISPASIIGDDEEASRIDWMGGQSAFMRNWPYAIAMSNDATQSQIAEKFAVTSLPSNAQSCIGGWQLGINKKSENQEAAWTFIKWMLGQDAQQYVGRMASFAVARQDMYTPIPNQYILERNPFFGQFETIIQRGQLRPRSSHYDTTSATLLNYLGQVLQKQITPEKAIDAMQTDLQKIINDKISAR